jgi:hypothetical protein
MVVEPVRVDPVDGAEQIVLDRGEGVLALDREAGPAGDLAGALVRDAVDASQAGMAGPGEAERASRPVILGAARDEAAPGGQERDRDALAGPRRDGPPVDLDGAVGGEARIGQPGHGGGALRTRAEDSQPGGGRTPKLPGYTVGPMAGFGPPPSPPPRGQST